MAETIVACNHKPPPPLSLSLSLSHSLTHTHTHTHPESVQKKYAKAWQMHRATQKADGEGGEATDKAVSQEKKDKDHEVYN